MKIIIIFIFLSSISNLLAFDGPGAIELFDQQGESTYVDSKQLSPILAGEIQKLINRQRPGKYLVQMSVFYKYSLNQNTWVSLPVVLTNLNEIIAPSKVENCSENELSLSCSLGGTMNLWLGINGPPNGSFIIDFQLFRPNGILLDEIREFKITF